MKPTLRTARPEDYDALCDLFNEADALHHDNLPHIFQKPRGALREKDHYLNLLADKRASLWIADHAGKIAGFLHVVMKDSPALPIFIHRRYAVVDEIVVRSSFQHQGIGRLLMDQAQAWAVERGAGAMVLNVYEFNQPAIAFYEKLGYRTYSRKMSMDLKRR